MDSISTILILKKNVNFAREREEGKIFRKYEFNCNIRLQFIKSWIISICKMSALKKKKGLITPKILSSKGLTVLIWNSFSKRLEDEWFFLNWNPQNNEKRYQENLVLNLETEFFSAKGSKNEFTDVAILIRFAAEHKILSRKIFWNFPQLKVRKTNLWTS